MLQITQNFDEFRMKYPTLIGIPSFDYQRHLNIIFPS